MHLVIEISLGMLFLFACVQKLRAPGVFASTLADYQILPVALLIPCSWMIVAAEAFAGAGLLSRVLVTPSLKTGVILLLGYSAGIALNLLRGRRYIDCGCTGPANRQTISEWLVVRNLTLAGAGMLCIESGVERELGVVDYTTVFFGLVVASLVYASVNFLIASGPKLRQLRGL